MSDTIKRGDLVLARACWGQEPTPANTGLVVRVARDGSWADVRWPGGWTKRMRTSALRKVDRLTVYVS